MRSRTNFTRAALILIAAALVAVVIIEARPAPRSHAATLPPLPAGWPSTLELGLASPPGGAGAMHAIAPYRFRYQYLAGGVNTGGGWATWNADGQFVTYYVNDSTANSIVPVFTYYQILQSLPATGSEADRVYNNMQNTWTMNAYYNDLKLFFQRAAGPNMAVLHVEPDLWGYLNQRASGDNAATVPASVASSAMPHVAGYADNVAGFAQAIDHLRDLYAPNVVLAYHMSVWGTGDDIVYSDPSDATVDAEAQRQGNFLNSLGGGFDIAFAEFSDRDAAFKQYIYGDGGAAWWNSGDYARNLRYLSKFVAVSGRRVVEWQVPQGNTKMRAMNNTWDHYQDNHAEWLLDDPARAHLTQYINAGVVGFLFGRGADGATCGCDAANDGVTDPAPINGNTGVSLNADDDGGFFQQKSVAYYAAGAMPLSAAPPYAVAWSADTTPASMFAAATSSVSISFTNTGSLTWPATGANPVRFSYHWRNGACPGASSAVWNGVRTALPGSVATGGAVSGLAAKVTAPAPAGTYCLVYDLVREGVTWFSSQGAATKTKTVSVTQPQYAVTWGSHNTPASMVHGSANNVTMSFTNGGALTWPATGANAVRLSYHWRNGACPGASTAVWDGARTSLAADVAGGASVSGIVAKVNAPAAAATYCLVYDLVREGVTWFSSQGAATLKITVAVTVT